MAKSKKFWWIFGIGATTLSVGAVVAIVVGTKNKWFGGDLKLDVKKDLINSSDDLKSKMTDAEEVYKGLKATDFDEIYSNIGQGAQETKATRGAQFDAGKDHYSFAYLFKTVSGQETFDKSDLGDSWNEIDNDFLTAWDLKNGDFSGVSKVIIWSHDDKDEAKIELFDVKKWNDSFIISNSVKAFTDLKFDKSAGEWSIF